MTPSEKETLLNQAVEAALLAWYGPDWQSRFFKSRPRGIEMARVAMRSAVIAALAVIKQAKSQADAA